MELSKIAINGGNIVVEQNCDGDEYKGVNISFEAKNGIRIDIAYIESKPTEYDKIDVYCYEDVWEEEWTRKYTLDTREMYEATESIS